MGGYKADKTRLCIMLRDFKDPITQNYPPDLSTRHKWDGNNEVKEIAGVVISGWHGLGGQKHG